LLQTLAQLYPGVFGDKPLPLKRGIYEDLIAAQPQALAPEELKAALALHTRSTRYLNAMAAGLARHNLDGQAVESPTPEQVHHALVEVFRRRLRRTREDLRPELRQRLLQAYEASGLDRESYAERVHGRDEEVNELTRDALAEAARRQAKDEALLRAFDASGKTVEEFADMYGLLPAEAQAKLDRARKGGPQAGAVNTVNTPE
jgi:sRNA-binding protein